MARFSTLRGLNVAGPPDELLQQLVEFEPALLPEPVHIGDRIGAGRGWFTRFHQAPSSTREAERAVTDIIVAATMVDKDPVRIRSGPTSPGRRVDAPCPSGVSGVSVNSSPVTRVDERVMAMMHGYGFAWPMGGMMVGWFLLTVLVVGLVVWLVAGPASAWGHRDDLGGARRILAERFARGDIDAEEYARLRNALR